jgi:hypothetical protein
MTSAQNLALNLAGPLHCEVTRRQDDELKSSVRATSDGVRHGVVRLRIGGSAVISLEDCLGLCGLTRDEVDALAEHEHIPEIAAAALGQYLLNQPGGCMTIRDMIAEDIRLASGRGDGTHAHELTLTLQHFVASHPEVGTLPPVQH